jgi:type I restriction enzyme, S subunit
LITDVLITKDINILKLEDTNIEIIDGDRGKQYPKKNELLNEGYCAFFNNKNITGDKISLEEVDYVTKEKDQLLRKGKAIINDIILTTRGSVGNVGLMHKRLGLDFARINSGMVILRNNDPSINTYYLYHLLKSPILKNQYKILSTGSAQPQLPIKDLKRVQLLIPPLDVQEKIVSILNALDRKIELNLEINKTLEKSAKALYKHWLIDFGPFQDRKFVDSELGMIPEEMEILEIGNAVQILGGGTPKTSVAEYWDKGSINWYSPTDLTSKKSLFITNSRKKITQIGLEKSSARIFPPYSVMMTSRATIGEISINREEASTNQGFITLIPNDTFTLYQLYFWLQSNMETILSISNGSTFKEVSKSNFRKLPIIKADGIDEFTNICSNMFKHIESNLIENDRLTNIRDYLLLRLLSGKINI